MPGCRILLLALVAVSSCLAVDFARDVRPILSDRCFTCHGPDSANRKTALRFDSEQSAFAPLASGGFAIVRGDPDESKLLARVESDDPVLRMPPAYAGRDKLSAGEINTLRTWIAEGAPWRLHWSFVKPVRPPSPPVGRVDWVRNPIDAFVLSRLEQEGLEPSPEAEPTTLARRLSLDLRGLPPTPKEVDEFLADRSEGAYVRLVRRMLDSPRYGERMAAPWLDAARYADTNGYQSDGVRDMWRWRDWVIDAFNSNMPFDRFTIEQIAGDLLPNARRDQIIASGFNRNHRSNAEGGIVEEEFRVEYAADRAETTGTVWLGLTIGCARCHDHKYDPITQAEYYRLFAYFNNTPDRGLVYNFGNEAPFIAAPTPEQEGALADLEAAAERAGKRWSSIETELREFEGSWAEGFDQAVDWKPAEGLTVQHSFEGDFELVARDCIGVKGSECAPTYVPGRSGRAVKLEHGSYLDLASMARFDYMDPFTFSVWINPAELSGAILSREEDAPEGMGYGIYLRDGRIWMHITRRWTDISLRLRSEPVVAAGRWQHLAVTYDGRHKGRGVKIYLDGKRLETEILFDELTYPLPAVEPFKIGAGGGRENRYSGLVDELHVWSRALTAEEVATLPVLETVDQIARIPVEQRSAGQQTKLSGYFLDHAAPARFRLARLDALDARRAVRRFRDEIPTVMVMQELPERRPTHVLRRGAYDAPGDLVEPGTPAIVSAGDRGAANDRLALARWLVSRDNPLTARVAVNRLWRMIFGEGLVRTAEDFGSQGEPPSHPELLDWLAVEFMDSGWDVKHLLETIVTSATYRQSSRATPGLIERDPQNRLLARGARFRLPAEMVRDQALYASGLLVEQRGGPSVKPYQPPGLWAELSGSRYQRGTGDDLYRRSLYTYWKRTVAPPSMINFDASDRESCTVRRPRTNTPLQALGLMNDVAFVEASRKMAERMIREGGDSPSERVSYGFRLVTARSPGPSETAALEPLLDRMLARYGEDEDAAWSFLGQGESAWDRRLEPAEIAAYANVAGLILNLDETVTRE